ncbi:hypothetical protein FACS189430_05830 [Bacteroidia bacterium]|nr:hypothetical protein FACS189430_05830 [Bacteroidia bacterium]
MSGNTAAIRYKPSSGTSYVTIAVSGGTVSAQGYAIDAQNATTATYSTRATINITGGTVTSYTQSAINNAAANTSSSVSITGGVLFGRTTAASDDITVRNIVSGNATAFDGTIGNAEVIIWGGITPLPTIYVANHASSSRLDRYPSSATARWDIVDGKSGVIYKLGTQEGFIEVPGVEVVTSTITISNTTTSAQINEDIEKRIPLNGIDYVTVAGSKTGVNEPLDITYNYTSKKLLWKAKYEAAANFSGTLITMGSNSGALEVADGGVVFGYGAAVSNVISRTSAFTQPTGTGIVIAWNKSAAGSSPVIVQAVRHISPTRPIPALRWSGQKTTMLRAYPIKTARTRALSRLAALPLRAMS